MEAEDALSAKASEIEVLQKELEKASENIKEKEEEHAALTSELKLATDASEKLTQKLSEDAAKFESERNKLADLDRFKSEASENKGRADSLSQRASRGSWTTSRRNASAWTRGGEGQSRDQIPRRMPRPRLWRRLTSSAIGKSPPPRRRLSLSCRPRATRSRRDRRRRGGRRGGYRKGPGGC